MARDQAVSANAPGQSDQVVISGIGCSPGLRRWIRHHRRKAAQQDEIVRDLFRGDIPAEFRTAEHGFEFGEQLRGDDQFERSLQPSQQQARWRSSRREQGGDEHAGVKDGSQHLAARRVQLGVGKT